MGHVTVTTNIHPAVADNPLFKAEEIDLVMRSRRFTHVRRYECSESIKWPLPAQAEQDLGGGGNNILVSRF